MKRRIKMPSSTFWGFQHLNANVLCSIGIDVLKPVNELFEIAIIPLDKFLEPHKELLLFNMRMKPYTLVGDIDWSKSRPSKSTVASTLLTGFDKDKVIDLFEDWFDKMDLNRGKQIIPLAHNYVKIKPVLVDWLGPKLYEKIFREDYRDTLVTTHFLNDKEDCRGQQPFFSKQDYRWIAKQLHVEILERGGSAMDEALAIAKIYRRLISH